MRKTIGTVLVAAAVLLGTLSASAAAGAATAGGGETSSGDAVTYVGKVKGLDASLAVVVEGGAAFAYLCDGEAISEWFKGSVEDGVLSLTSPDGSSLFAGVSAKKVKGQVLIADAFEEFHPQEGDRRRRPLPSRAGRRRHRLRGRLGGAAQRRHGWQRGRRHPPRSRSRAATSAAARGCPRR